jgi:polysaccharide export outer membrane protein
MKNGELGPRWRSCAYSLGKVPYIYAYKPKSMTLSKAVSILFITLLGLSSCVTQKKTTYLQLMEPPTDSIYRSVTPETYRVQVNDNLYIRVVTPDPRLSSMFNSMPVNAATMAGEAAIDLVSYPVQDNGTVEIPFVGELEVVGLTLAEIKDKAAIALKDYITDADITIKLVNNYVSVIGEVARPGLYPIYKQQMNIFQAISMAGDLTEYSDRMTVQVVRQTLDGSEISQFNLTDRNIVDSKYYYVMPNDVIYVRPMKGKFFAMNSFPYAVVLSTITTFILILNLINATSGP